MSREEDSGKGLLRLWGEKSVGQTGLGPSHKPPRKLSGFHFSTCPSPKFHL